MFSRILQVLFYAVFTGVSEYFKADKLKAWMFFVKRVLDIPVPDAYRQQPAAWNGVLQAEHQACWKAKVRALKVVNKLLFHVRMVGKQEVFSQNRAQFLEAFQQEFYSSYLEGFFQTSLQICKMNTQVFVVPSLVEQAIRNIFNCLQEPRTVLGLGLERLWNLVVEVCIPGMVSNLKDREMWHHDPAGYISSRDSRVDLHNAVRIAAKDLLLFLTGLTPRELGFQTNSDRNILSFLYHEYMSVTLSESSELALKFDARKFLEFSDDRLYSTTIFEVQNPGQNRPSPPTTMSAFIEGILMYADKGDTSTPIIATHHKRAAFSFVLSFVGNPYISLDQYEGAEFNFQIVRLLDKFASVLIDEIFEYRDDLDGIIRVDYGIEKHMRKPVNPQEYLGLVGKYFEANIMSKWVTLQTMSLVVMARYISISPTAKDMFRSAVCPLLRIAVPLLNKIDHKNVVEAINILVKEYPEDISAVSGELLWHISQSFHGYLIHSKNNPNNDEESDDSAGSVDSVQEDNYEAFRAASACIDTVHRLLFLKSKLLLQPDNRENTERLVLEMLLACLMKEDKDMYQSCLLVLPALFQPPTNDQPPTLSSALKFFFPIICYVLTETRTGGELKIADTNVIPSLVPLTQQLPPNFQEILREVNYTALSEEAMSASFVSLVLFSTVLGIETLANEREYYLYPGSEMPRTYLQMLYDTVKFVIGAALTSTSDLDIVMSLRVFSAVLASLEPSGRVTPAVVAVDAEQMNRLVIDMIDFGLNLANEGGNRNRVLRVEILSLICTCISVRPALSIEHLHSKGHLNTFSQAISSLPQVNRSQIHSLLSGLAAALWQLGQTPNPTSNSQTALLPLAPSLLSTALGLSLSFGQQCLQSKHSRDRVNNARIEAARSEQALNQEMFSPYTHRPLPWETVLERLTLVTSLDSSVCDDDEAEDGSEGDANGGQSEVVLGVGGGHDGVDHVDDIGDAEDGAPDGEYEMLAKEIKRLDKNLEKKKRLMGIQFFTPNERTCQLGQLKNVLEHLEKSNPELAKNLVSTVGITKIPDFLKAVELSQDYYKYLDHQRNNYL